MKNRLRSRITVSLTPDLLNRTRLAVALHRHTTLRRMVEEALECHLAKMPSQIRRQLQSARPCRLKRGRPRKEYYHKKGGSR